MSRSLPPAQNGLEPLSPVPEIESKGVVNSSLSTWRVVLSLAWPVLAQQFLILMVTLSDSFLAGFYEPFPPDQKAKAVGHQLMSLGILGVTSPGSGLGATLIAIGPLAAASHLIGRHIAYQAAQTTAHYLAWVISSYTVFVSVGSTALVARFIGAGDRGLAAHVTNQSVLLSVVMGLGGTVFGLVGLEPFLALLQLHGDTIVLARNYLRPLFLLLVFQVLEAACIACLVGAGDTRTGMWVRASVTLINLPMAWSFFHGLGPIPALGFEGIALGTAVSNGIGGIAVLTALARGWAGLGLEFRLMVPAWGLLWRLLRISIPAGLDSLSIVLGQLWFLGIVNRLGEVAGSAHGIALRWEALGYLSGAAFGTAAMTLVGQNLGAGKPLEAMRSGWVAFAMGCGTMCIMGGIFFFMAPQMFLLFCPHPEQRPAVEAGVPVLRLVAFAMPALACCIIFSYALRGAGDTRVPMLFTWIGFLAVRIPLAYLFTFDNLHLGKLGTLRGYDLGLFGAWMAMFADLVVRGAFFLHRFASGRWQKVRV